jgi:putative nucleotidyltransferase with HDIG domain
MAGIASARQIYGRAVDTAAELWDTAKAGAPPSAVAAGSVASTLAALLARDSVSLIALAASPNRDDASHYTFTHMVNVAALTMAQAAALNIDGPLLHAFGVAALMHDIGKVHTPPEVLHKPEGLTPEETIIVQRHVLDGAAILRRTRGITPLAAVVALEHHLREDFSGYPENLGRRALNACTLLVTIADVFDALRSDRPYRRGLAASRVRAIMSEQDSRAFNRPLLARFIGLMGLFPVGSLVRLHSGELAVVTAERADNARRPRVKVIVDALGTPLEHPRAMDTFDPDDRDPHSRTVAEVVDPAAVGIDPLAFL